MTLIEATTHPDKLFEISANDPIGGTVHKFPVAEVVQNGILTLLRRPPCDLAEVTAVRIDGQPAAAWELTDTGAVFMLD